MQNLIKNVFIYFGLDWIGFGFGFGLGLGLDWDRYEGFLIILIM
jgi:hypothetical protein